MLIRTFFSIFVDGELSNTNTHTQNYLHYKYKTTASDRIYKFYLDYYYYYNKLYLLSYSW